MAEYQKYINALRKCAKEHENDRTSTGHIIVSDLCRDTANLLESLEQEPILDKMKAEFISLYPKNYVGEPELGGVSCTFSLNKVLEIINKYKAESENKE